MRISCDSTPITVYNIDPITNVQSSQNVSLSCTSIPQTNPIKYSCQYPGIKLTMKNIVYVIYDPAKGIHMMATFVAIGMVIVSLIVGAMVLKESIKRRSH